MKDKRVAIYVQECQQKIKTVDMQLNDLERYSKERGFNVFKIYKDNGVSGTKETRPALSELMNDAKKRKFDTVLGMAVRPLRTVNKTPCNRPV